MSWAGKQWLLGTGTHPLHPRYGARVPLSFDKTDYWVKCCALCGADLDEHPAIDPGAETMWLAKLYANALLEVWLHSNRQSPMPAMACAAKATYGDNAALYYVAPTEGSMNHNLLRLPNPQIVLVGLLSGIAESFLSLIPPLCPEGMRDGDLVMFCDPVMRVPPAGQSTSRFQLAINAFPTNFWNPQGGQMQRMYARLCSLTRKKTHSIDDADGGFDLLSCAEQRVLLAHRWVSKHPADLGLPSGIKLELREMTVALADYEIVSHTQGALKPKVPSALAIWRRKWDNKPWWFGEAGFPMHPCNTCRVALPPLLCPLPCDGVGTLPDAKEVIPDPAVTRGAP